MKKKSIYIISILSLYFVSCGSVETDRDETNNNFNIEVKEDVDALNKSDLISYEGKAMEIIQTSFMILSKNVKNAMGNGGVQNAVQFCNLNASILTDSLSKAHHVIIQRITNKYRNAGNKLKDQDQTVWDLFTNKKESGDSILPFTEIINDEIVTYAPILLNKPLCLNCHGVVGKAISESDYEFIHSLYPEDRAVGYALGDLRGMWKITQTKN